MSVFTQIKGRTSATCRKCGVTAKWVEMRKTVLTYAFTYWCAQHVPNDSGAGA